MEQQQQQHPIYSGLPLRRDGEGPLDPIEWVQWDQKIRTGYTPRGELNNSQEELPGLPQVDRIYHSRILHG